LQDRPQKVTPGTIDRVESSSAKPIDLVRQRVVVIMFRLMLHPHLPLLLRRTRILRRRLPIFDVTSVQIGRSAGTLIGKRKDTLRS
jgi:hypothetical protein